jgi:tRNA-2-methylthio-N6-dimethylallyladenosine synthase
MPHYYIWTIGCQMNEAESERLAARLVALGYTEAAQPETADIILLNSCVVRASAENKAVNKLAALKSVKKARPEVTIALTGCLVDSNIEQMQKRFPQVDYFFRAGEIPDFLPAVENERALPEHPAVAVNVPIMQGCNNFCTYCIVPYRRGRERSRAVAEVVSEVKGLVGHGAKEVTLLGQNVDAYGKDLPGKPDLADLLTEVDKIDGLYRIRFLTSHPRDMTGNLIDTIANLEKVCPVISLPVQAGSNEILTAMRRGYTREEYIDLVKRIRERILDVALSTDVIVGFPGETEAQFRETYDLLAELKFDSVHIAAYSPRPGTYATEHLSDDVLPAEKKARVDAVEKLQEGIATEINAAFLGRTVEVLVEGKKNLKWYGRTKSDKLVFFTWSDDFTGRLVDIEVTHTSPWSLSGKIAGCVSR